MRRTAVRCRQLAAAALVGRPDLPGAVRPAHGGTLSGCSLRCPGAPRSSSIHRSLWVDIPESISFALQSDASRPTLARPSPRRGAMARVVDRMPLRVRLVMAVLTLTACALGLMGVATLTALR